MTLYENLVAMEAYKTGSQKKVKEDVLTDDERAFMDELNAQHKSNLKSSYIMRDYCDRLINKNLKSRESALFKYISNFRDKNIDTLSSPYITKIIIFGPEDEDILFKCTGTTQAKLQDIMDTVEDLPINTNKLLQEKVGKTVHQKNITPFRVMCFFIFRYYFMKGDMEKAEEMLFYYAVSQYRNIFANQFRNGVQRPSAMEYAIDHMENRYTLKKEGSLEKAIIYPVKKAGFEKYVHFVKDGSDWWVQYIIGQFKTREAGVIKSVRQAYDIAYANGNINKTADAFSDDTGEMVEIDTKSGTIEVMANKYATKFYSTNINQMLVKQMSSSMHVSATELRTVLENMQQERKSEELINFYECLFTAYYELEKHLSEDELHSANFIYTAQQIYKKGNSNDQNIKTIKAIAHNWLERGSASYRASNNAGTLNYFRSAIYFYFVFAVLK